MEIHKLHLFSQTHKLSQRQSSRDVAQKNLYSVETGPSSASHSYSRGSTGVITQLWSLAIIAFNSLSWGGGLCRKSVSWGRSFHLVQVKVAAKGNLSDDFRLCLNGHRSLSGVLGNGQWERTSEEVHWEVNKKRASHPLFWNQSYRQQLSLTASTFPGP